MVGKGGLKIKKGSIKRIGIYKGVFLKDLFLKFGWLLKNYCYVIIVVDGYLIIVDYGFIFGKGLDIYDEKGNLINGFVIFIFVYEYNGELIEFILDGKVYFFKFVFVGDEMIVIFGNCWVKVVVKIEVVKVEILGESENIGYGEVKDFVNRIVKVKSLLVRIVLFYGLVM